jgi:L-alanine-DL-glutamate epimerase-like enolase superfamily enzyme
VAASTEEVAAYRDKGFVAAKIKVGGLDPGLDAERVRATRAAVGDGFGLFVDANCGYTGIQALDFVHRVADLRVGWIEEPVRPDDLRGSRALVRLGLVPVAGYESETSAAAFRDLVILEAVDIVQADVIWTGGFTQVRRLAALAHAFELPFIPHVYSSAVSLVANAHLLAAVPNGGRLEFDARIHPLRDELVSGELRLDGNCVFSLPEGPGLGITLNPEAIAAYRIDL